MRFLVNLRPALAFVAVLGTLLFLLGDADARVGGSRSFGSRGSRTYSAPPPTSTAPSARPIERSMTQPSAASRGTPGAAQGGFFSRMGFGGGLMAGLLGAGLLGMLFGNGFLGGLGGIASMFGLLLQIGLVVIVARLLWSWWQRRSQPALAAGMSPRIADEQVRTGMGGYGPASAVGGARLANVEVSQADYNAFERRLKDLQAAYSREDLDTLRRIATPEMVSYFAEQLAKNASRGVRNEVTQVSLLQGDLAEAWREGKVEYATVAMRFTLVDRTVERATGRLVEGSDVPATATELWTFMRSGHGEWLVSAIQQT